MKILQLVQKPQRRGAEIFAFQLSAELRQQACTVATVYLYSYAGHRPLPLLETDRCLGGRESHRLERTVGFHPVLLRRLARAIDEFQPEVVQANGSRTLKYGALARALTPHRWVLIYRNIADPREWVAGSRRRHFYRNLVMPRVDGVVGVSDATLHNVEALHSLRVPIARIPRAMDVDGFIPTRDRDEVRESVRTPSDAPVVLFVGSLTAEKRPDRLLRVFAHVRRQLPVARLWLIGEGPLRPQVEAQLARDGLAETVRVLGVQDQIADFMHAADVLVLTSDTEGTPGVVLEAGAASLPVVSTRVGGVGACVIEGETGLLVDRADEPGLAAALLSLLGDTVRRAELGAAAQALVAKSFAIGPVAEDYLDFYRRVLSEQGQLETPHR